MVYCKHEIVCCCCKFLRDARELDKEEIIRITPYSSKKLLECRAARNPSSILKHIRECCGYGEFLEELGTLVAGGSAASGNLPATVDEFLAGEEMFLFYLAMLLREDLKQDGNYERLYNILPIIKKTALLACNGYTDSSQMSDYHLFGDVVDINVFLDFLYLFTRLDIFQKIMCLHYLSLDILLSDLDKIVETGEDIPDSVSKFLLKLRSAGVYIRDNNPKQRDKQDYKLFLVIDGIWKRSSVAGNSNMYDMCLKLAKYKENEVRLLEKGTTQSDISTERRDDYGEFMGFSMWKSTKSAIAEEDTNELVYLAAKYQFPIYIGGRRTYISGICTKKSARK